MNKKDLVNAVASKAGIMTHHAEAAIEALGDVITCALQNNQDVTIPKVGKLASVHKPARTGKHPITGAVIEHRAKSVPKFKPAAALKQALIPAF